MQKTRKVTFTLPADIVADASSGLLLGEFNNWNKAQGFSLKKSKDGSMKTTVELEEGKSYAYRYLLDGGRWVNDLNASTYTEAQGLGVLNCVVNVAAETIATNPKPKKTTAKTPKPEKQEPAADAVKGPGIKTAAAEKKAAGKKSVK